jgi:hypothetical protein
LIQKTENFSEREKSEVQDGIEKTNGDFAWLDKRNVLPLSHSRGSKTNGYVYRRSAKSQTQRILE